MLSSNVCAKLTWKIVSETVSALRPNPLSVSQILPNNLGQKCNPEELHGTKKRPMILPVHI